MEKELKFDYDEKLKKFCMKKGIWDDKNQKPIRFVINKLKTIEVKHPDGYTYQQQIFDGFTTKRPKFKICLYCHKKLSGKQKRFCSPRCGDLRGKVDKKRIELGAEGIWITKDWEGLPQWKNMVATFRDKNGKLIIKENALTKKLGKPRKRETIDFSKGKDY